MVASRNDLVDEGQLKEIAALVGAESSDVARAFELARRIPIFKTQSHTNAEAINRELISRGIESAIIAEDQIALANPPIEVRGLELSDECVTAISRRDQQPSTMKWPSLSLIVAGRLHVSRVEVERKRKRKPKVVAERRFSTDEAVIDIYQHNERVPWRIKSNSFDFSCLGNRKAMTAFENLASLVELLRQRATSAEFNDDYFRLRPLLDNIWPVQGSEQPAQRRWAGRQNVEAIVTDWNNEAQFSCYSRLLYFRREQI